MPVVNAVQVTKSVADPCAAYASIQPLWKKARAVIGGERFVKDYDGLVDTLYFSNLLLPFSPVMTQQQFDFYKAEAELPGIVSQYSRIIIGGLLRKQPQLKLPDTMDEALKIEAYEWIMNAFSHDNSPLVSFLDDALWEEVQTSRAWVYVDYPKVTKLDELSVDQVKALKPYPVLWPAESIINWNVSVDAISGMQTLQRVIVRNYEETYDAEHEWHPVYKDTVYVHELVNGLYQIRKFQKEVQDAQILVINGKLQQDYAVSRTPGVTDPLLSQYKLIETNTDLYCNNERLTRIPAWPLNGSMRVVEPMMTNIVDREIALYNKVSRRNHLLYGAASYTPVVSSNMEDDEFEKIVNAGLGSWIKLRQGDTAECLATPTDALADMEKSILATLDELARMGVKMLQPDVAQSGVALDIRNAAQTAQLGTLNTKVSNQIADIIAFMINWRYDLELSNTDVNFQLSADFNPTPLGADWLRLCTEWYEKGYLPRSEWLSTLKQNDILSPDYDDTKGQEEITNDGLIQARQTVTVQSYSQKIAEAAGLIPDPNATTGLAGPLQGK